MSEYQVVELEMTDGDCIIKALEELGYKAEVHDTAQQLIGWHGDMRTQKANIIVRRKDISSASNDIGFLKKADGNYEMIISEFDRHATHSKDFLEKLNQMYGKHCVIQKARQMGYTVSSTTIDDQGRLKLRIMSR